MDALNAAFVTAFAADAQFNAAAPGGLWNGKADEGTPLPLTKFQLVVGQPGRTFGALATLRFVYQFISYAEDTAQAAGAERAAVVNAHVRRVIDAAQLSVAGHEVLACQWIDTIPQGDTPGKAGKDELSEGVLVEVVLAPNP